MILYLFVRVCYILRFHLSPHCQ